MKQLVQSRKKQNIFDSAKDLFWKYGIKRVSVEEICREANVSKMTFYNYFPNKIELAKALLDILIDSSITMFKDIIASDIPFSEKLKAIFLMKIEGMNNFSMEFINDVYRYPKSGLMDYMEEKQRSSKNILIDFYKNAQANGHIRKEVKIDFILAYSSVIVEAMKDEALMVQYEKPQDFVIECMNLLFYGIVSR